MYPTDPDRGGTVIKGDGPTAEVLEDYLREVEARAGAELETRTHRSGRGRVRIAGIRVDSPTGVPTAGAPLASSSRFTGEPVPIECWFDDLRRHGQRGDLFQLGRTVDRRHRRRGDVLQLDALLLRPGRYRINAALTAPDGNARTTWRAR